MKDPSRKRRCDVVVLRRLKRVLTAQAEAEKIRLLGEAEAGSIEVVGKAEAEKMRLKAEAYLQYGEAAKTALVLEALPKVRRGGAPRGAARWGGGGAVTSRFGKLPLMTSQGAESGRVQPRCVAGIGRSTSQCPVDRSRRCSPVRHTARWTRPPVMS